jgi:hypothetical protein
MISQAEKDRIFDMAKFINVTINGEPARVCGRLLDFPVVTSGLYHAEFSWPAVERVLQAGGDFALL